MEAPLLASPGDSIQPEEISVPKAQDLLTLLRSGHLAHVRFVEARRLPKGDVVIFDIEPEVPQYPAASIASVERIAVTFFTEDRQMPETVALRASFPAELPHLNLRPSNHPWRSLCLYEESYADVRLRWTSADYIRQVHHWLSKTARGELHAAEQGLEPFILADARTIILPRDLFESKDQEDLSIYALGSEEDFVLVATHRSREDVNSRTYRAVLIVASPQVHGVVHHQPSTLEELHLLLEPLGISLLGLLRERLRSWMNDQVTLKAQLVIVAAIPRSRTEGAEAEVMDTWVFLTGLPLVELGTEIGVWSVVNGTRGGLVEPDLTRRGSAVPLELLRPVFALTPRYAAELSSLAPDMPRVTAIGAGALGSQVIENAARTGWGEWSIVDDDYLLPHNLVRHALPGPAGIRKAIGTATYVNMIYGTEGVARGIVANVLEGSQSEQLKKALEESDLILDLAASPTVGRYLATQVPALARRISLFLNPAGTDLVMLGEDAERRVRLDDLEMQHYRAVIREDSLVKHLRPPDKRTRYGRSCRDVTTLIPQTRLAVAAGIGASAVRKAAETPEARIQVWLLRVDLGVDTLSPEVHEVHWSDQNGWHVRYDNGLLSCLRELRFRRLPHETGGVLLGHRDMDRHILYIVEALPAPPDSKERPTYFERGATGLRAQVEEITGRTAGALVYVGEWHSHPPEHGVKPSDDDRDVFTWLHRHLAPEGLPPLMVIVGDREFGLYVGRLD